MEPRVAALSLINGLRRRACTSLAALHLCEGMNLLEHASVAGNLRRFYDREATLQLSKLGHVPARKVGAFGAVEADRGNVVVVGVDVLTDGLR